VYAEPPSPLGIRINASGLTFALQCNLAVDDGAGNPESSAEADLFEVIAQPPESACP
jgi:hypothetical protein